MIRALLALCVAGALAACSSGGSVPAGGTGSGSGSSSTSSTSSTTTSSSSGGTTLTNFATVTVDAGPAALNVGPNAYTSTNSPFVSVTICAPGSATNCQTIDHVILDTGSVGLRIVQSVLNTSLLTALPTESDASGNPVGECYQYVNSYVFGSVRQADFAIGGEKVANMPFNVMGDTGSFSSVPSSCSSGGGTETNTVQTFGGNGILGVGTTPTDCGADCQVTNGSAAATYYDCPSSGCATIITRNASTVAPFQQLPNPVAAFSTDNNGTIISLPAVAPAGVVTLTGTIYFGIGTQTNNALSGATVLPASLSTSAIGSGLVTATYNGTKLPISYIDSGTNAYYFVDSAIATCKSTGFSGFYCPTSALSLAPTITGTNGTVGNASFTLYNAETSPAATSNAVPGIGVNPNVPPPTTPITNSFAFGLPFFFGRNVYTAIEGRNAGGVAGPYFAY